jgi:hypothetical protein
MKWQTRAQAQERVRLTLSALAGELPGFHLKRQVPDGWIPTFFNKTTGAALNHNPPVYTTLDTGLNSAGCLFARTYFTSTSAVRDTTPQAVSPRYNDCLPRLGCVTAFRSRFVSAVAVCHSPHSRVGSAHQWRLTFLFTTAHPSVLPVLQRAATAEIARLGAKVFGLVNFTNLLCSADGKVAPNGVGGVAIPFTFSDDGIGNGLHLPKPDG